jgi:HEAT repeat protein
VNEKNPGLRLRTVNTISSQLETEKFNADPKIKNALITALKIDDNPAVRREALNALIKFPFDGEIRDAYLFVLSNDHNSGMRVAAINALAQLKVEGTSLDDKILNVLNRKAENDESDFIRLRAASLVREVK